MHITVNKSLLLITAFFFFTACQEEEPDPVNDDPIVEECDKDVIIDNTNSIEGYTDKESYWPGETVHFMLHNTASECDIEIIRHGVTDESIEVISSVTTTAQNYNCRSYSFGCDWDVTYSYDLPASVESGIYSAKLTNDLGESFNICFVVKGDGAAEYAVLANTNTWQAYNDWGGHSFYRYDLDEERQHSEIISFDRPNVRAIPYGNTGHLVAAELHLHRWMTTKGYDYEVISDRDIHDGIIDLSNYQTLVLNVHPEYWTPQMKFFLNVFIQNGGNIINLGANCIYWKSIIVDNKIEKKKKGHNFFLEPNEPGGRWRDLNEHESALLGVQYDRRGYNTYHPYIVYNSSHWVFSGTGLNDLDIFGDECLNGAGASGLETDKMTTLSPSSTVFLAKGSNPEDGGASMIYYEHSSGSKIFSAGSITYTGSLSVDPVLEQITTNVFEYFH